MNEILTLRTENRKVFLQEDGTLKAVYYPKNIHFLNPEGKYHWTPEYYNILEREPRDDDEDHHIVFDLLSDEDRKEVEELIDKLGPNEFLGNVVKPITLESGKVKHININGRKIFDKEGKFVRESGCVQDVSEVVEFENALMKADYEKRKLA